MLIEQRVRRIFIVVLSHTNPAGDIHIAPKDAGAAIADQVRSSIEEIVPKLTILIGYS